MAQEPMENNEIIQNYGSMSIGEYLLEMTDKLAQYYRDEDDPKKRQEFFEINRRILKNDAEELQLIFEEMTSNPDADREIRENIHKPMLEASKAYANTIDCLIKFTKTESMELIDSANTLIHSAGVLLEQADRYVSRIRELNNNGSST